MKDGKPLWGIIGLGIVIVAVVAVVVVAISHNRAAELKPGTASFILKTNGGVPYEWKCAVDDEAIAKLGEVKTKALDPSMDGGVVEETHAVEAVKEGVTRVTCEYKNFADGTDRSYDTKEYHVEVDKDLKIELQDITSTIQESAQ